MPSTTPSPPPGVLVSGHFKETRGYRAFRPHGSGSWLLIYTVAGEGYFRQPDGADLSARAGDAYLLAPTAYHDYGVPREKARWELHWTHFQTRPDWTSWLDLNEPGSGLYHAHVSARPVRRRIAAAFERLHRDKLAGGPLAELLCVAALEEVLLVLVREGGRKARPIDARVADVLERIQADPAARHTVSSLAKGCALSPSRFAHLFKSETGDAVTRMILKLRVAQARRLLAFTSEPISQIAEAVGFASPFYFSRQFKSLTGASPRAYRDSFRAEP